MPATAHASHRDPVNAVDRDHLRAMTMGDEALAREVLGLFDKQAELIVSRMRQADPQSLAALAHALKGSARGIGAWQVATAAEGVERDGADGGVALDRLAQAVALARADIAVLLAV